MVLPSNDLMASLKTGLSILKPITASYCLVYEIFARVFQISDWPFMLVEETTKQMAKTAIAKIFFMLLFFNQNCVSQCVK